MGLFDGKKGMSLGKNDKLGNKLDTIFFTDTSKEEAAQKAALEAALGQYDKFGLPVLDKMDPALQQWLQDVDAHTVEGPDKIAAQSADLSRVGPSAFEDISVDPRLKDQQMASLAALNELATGGGMTAADKAQLDRIQSQVGQADRGRRDAILQNAAARGMGGSGMEMLAQLDSSQASTDRQAQQSMDIAGMAQQRALDAMLQSGNLAGSMRGQDFGEAAQRAAAMDAIGKFNAQNANQMSQWNAGTQNDMARYNSDAAMKNKYYNADQQTGADRYNNAGRQSVADANTGISNGAQQYNLGLNQQQFGNKMSVASAKANAQQGLANYYGGQAAQMNADAAAARSGAIQAAGAAMTGGASLAATAAANKAAAQNKPAGANTTTTMKEREDQENSPYFVGPKSTTSDETAKKNVKSVSQSDLDEFLACLSPKQYQYKDKKDGEGDYVGIIAQDLTKSKVGKKMVSKDETGKMQFDNQKMLSALVAALGHLADKVEEAT